MSNTLGERIKLARLSRNMTQDELAQAAQTSKQNIYKYETGIITNIPLDRVELLANALLVTPGWLMGWCSVKSQKAHPISDRVRYRVNAELSAVDQADLEEARMSQNIELLDQIVEDSNPVSVDDAVEITDILGISLDDLLGEGKPASSYELSNVEQEFVEKYFALNPTNRRTLLLVAAALLKDQAADAGSQG